MIEGAHDAAVFLKTMVLALVLNPEAQQKAWEEIESVVGSERMPTYSDLDNLPYTKALIQEVEKGFSCFSIHNHPIQPTPQIYRWRPAVPLVFPHRNVDDIVVSPKCYILSASKN